jgi:hypothetical protein
MSEVANVSIQIFNFNLTGKDWFYKVDGSMRETSHTFSEGC